MFQPFGSTSTSYWCMLVKFRCTCSAFKRCAFSLFPWRTPLSLGELADLPYPGSQTLIMTAMDTEWTPHLFPGYLQQGYGGWSHLPTIDVNLSSSALKPKFAPWDWNRVLFYLRIRASVSEKIFMPGTALRFSNCFAGELSEFSCARTVIRT